MHPVQREQGRPATAIQPGEACTVSRGRGEPRRHWRSRHLAAAPGGRPCARSCPPGLRSRRGSGPRARDLMDPTAEDLVQLSDNCKETHSLPQEIEEFLQDYAETHESRTPAAPETQIYMPLTARGDDSQQKFIQNQVMAPLRPTMVISACSNIPGTVLDQNSTTLPVNAFDMPTGELNKTVSLDQKVTSFDQRKPKATSWMTGVTDNPKTLFTDCQKTTIAANNMILSKEGSQMKTLSDEQTVYGGQMIFGGDQIYNGGQMTFGGNQTRYGGQMTFGGDQACYGGHMTFGGDQTRYGGHMTFGGDQTRYGGHMTFDGDQTRYGGHMTFGGDQTRYGGQMTFSGDQTRYGGQMTFSGDQTCYGGQMTFSGDQTYYGGQMTALKGGYPVTFIGNQTFTGGQVTTYSSDQTLCGGQMATLVGNQMRAFTEDHTLCGSRMMPCPSPSVPYPGFLYCSSSHLTQGQSLEEQKSKFKTQRHQFKKNLDILKPYICTYQDCQKSYSKHCYLQIHQRKHTGEKPYKCNAHGCTWAFARSDELKRHIRRHSGERPYPCTVCSKQFARSDHLKQHQKVHQST